MNSEMNYLIDRKKLKKRRKLKECNLNSTDTKNAHNVGDHNDQPKRYQKRSRRKIVPGDLWRSANSGLINAAKFAVEKKTYTLSKLVQVDTLKFPNRPAKLQPDTKKTVMKSKSSPPLPKKEHVTLPKPSNSQPVNVAPPPVQHKPKKPWLQYSHNAQNALAILNNEVSSALCEVLGSIDSIQMRVRATMDEIKECDKVYEHLRHYKKCASTTCHSLPILTELNEPLSTEHSERLNRALDIGLIQTQSENQMRIALLPNETEVSSGTPEGQSSVHDDSLALFVQPKRVFYNVPPQLESETTDEISIVQVKKKKEPGGHISDTGEDLPRKSAHPNLHKRLVKEFEAADSLLEFEKRMKPKNPKKKGELKVVEIAAEELFVPEKVNKIGESNLESTTSNKKFLYQEVKKVRKKSAPASKYHDSVMFPKAEKCDNQSCNIVMETIGEPIYHLKQALKPSIHSVNKSGLTCFDIIDEITLDDVLPLNSEYPRKDEIGREVESTFLYKIVHEPMQDQFLELLRFQEPTVECAQQCDRCLNLHKKLEKPEREVPKPIKHDKLKKETTPDIILPKKIASKKSKKTEHEEIIAKLRQYMFDPHTRYPTTITVMPVIVTTYTNPNFIDNSQKSSMEKNSGGDFALPSPKKKSQKSSKLHAKDEKPKKWITKQSRATSPHNESWGDYETPTKRSPQHSKQPGNTKSVPYKQTKGIETKKPQKPNRKFESNIQSLIELIEHKIVEILSNPKKTHIEAFKSVETKILELLQTQKSLESIVENTKRPQFLSKTTSHLDKMKKKLKNGFVSKTHPLLINNVQSLPLHIMRLNLKTPTLKTIDESTITTKSIVAANTISEQTSCTFPQITPSVKMINFLNTLANISKDDHININLCRCEMIFYKFSIQISYPLSLPAVFYNVTIHCPLSITNQTPFSVKSNSSLKGQRGSSLPVRTYKILPGDNTNKNLPKRRVTFNRNEKKREEQSPKRMANRDEVEWTVVHQFNYNYLLNCLYGTLFTIEFLGLAFNYTCK